MRNAVFFALAFNLCWEFFYSLLLEGDWNVQRAINLLWLLFDVVILVLYCKYEKKYFEKEYSTGFWFWTLLTFAVAFSVVLTAKDEFPGFLGAQYTAFVQNLMMSVLFIRMCKEQNSAQGQSLGIAVAKMVGTLAPSVLVFAAKGSRLLLTSGFAILIFDLIYIYLLQSTLIQKLPE